MKRLIAFVFFFLVVISSVFAAPVKVTKKLITETLEQAAKKSGKVLTPAMREALEKALMKAFKQYGDDVFKVVSHGGLEALEQGGKHGKVFWELCSHSPQAARSLAMHADDLLPIAKRIGPDFMKLETHVPGLAKQAVTSFGDDATKMIVKMSPDDAAKLIKYGSKADSPQTAKLLFEGCQKTSGEILKHLDGKKIVAFGLSASMITAAYKISNGAEAALVKTGDGVEKGLTEIATNSPEQFTNPISHGIKYFFICVAIIVCFIFACQTYLKSLVVRSNEHPCKSKDISSEDDDASDSLK